MCSPILREAKEETSIDVKLENLINIYSKPDRDPRGHTISIVYSAKGNLEDRKANDDACDIGIFNKDELSKVNIAFDHEKIIKDCLINVKNKF